MVAHAFMRDKRILIAKVDATTHTATKERYNVDAFPTLVWYPSRYDGSASAPKPEKFSGARTTERMVAFVNERAGTSAHIRGASVPPTLTDTAKARAMERMKAEMGGGGPGATASISSPSASGSKPKSKSKSKSKTKTKSTSEDHDEL